MPKHLHGIRVAFMRKGFRDDRVYNIWIVAYTKAEAIKLLKDYFIVQKGYRPGMIDIIGSYFMKSSRPERICEEYYKNQFNAVYGDKEEKK